MKWALTLMTFVLRMLCSVGLNEMPVVVLVILSRSCRTSVFVHLMPACNVPSSSVAVVCLFQCRKYCKRPRLTKRHHRQIWPDMVFLPESIMVLSIISRNTDTLSVSCRSLRVQATSKAFRVISRSSIIWTFIFPNLLICQNKRLRIKSYFCLLILIITAVLLDMLRVILNINITNRKLMAISVVIFHFGI